MHNKYVAQVWAVFTSTLGALTDGMHYGWTSPAIPILRAPGSQITVTENDEMWLETIYLLGSFFGLPITIYLVDKIGRKPSLLASAAAGLLTWSLIGLANRVEYIYVARLLAGVTANMAFVTAPMYIAEISEERMRGFLTGLVYIMMLVGNLMVYSITPFVKIFVSALVPCCVLCFMLSTFTFVPESPYYLLLKNKKVEAEKSLKWLRASHDVEEEFQEIVAAVARQDSEKGNVKELVTVSSNRKALFILFLVNFGQNFGAISVMFMNMHLILESGGSTYIPTEYAAIIFATFLLIAGSVTVGIVDKIGRKKPLIMSCALTGLSLATLATYFAVKQAGIDTSKFSWLPIVNVMLYAIFYKSGMGIIPVILLGELFPTSVKAIGMTISDASYVVFGAMSLYMYLPLARYYGIHVPLYIFSACCFSLAVICWVYIPETKGKTLEEIQFILKGISIEDERARNSRTPNHDVTKHDASLRPLNPRLEKE